MSILNLNTPQGRGPVGKKSVKIWMGVGLLAAVLGFGSTFAANITLNSNTSPTEFGQGVQRTVYCGGSAVTLTLKPNSSFDSGSNQFGVSSISVSGIPSACKSLNFVLGVYSDSETARQEIAAYDGATLITPTVYWAESATAVFVASKNSSERLSSSSSCQDRASSGATSSTRSGALLSLLSTEYSDPCKIAYLSSVTQPNASTLGAFTIAIKTRTSSSGGYRIMSLANFDKMTIETQSDAFGYTAVSASGSTGRGLVNN